MHTIRGVWVCVCVNTHAGVWLLITTKQWVTIWQQRALGNFPSCLIRNSREPRASPHQLTLGPGQKITIIKLWCARERKIEPKSRESPIDNGIVGERTGRKKSDESVEEDWLSLVTVTKKQNKTLAQKSSFFPLISLISRTLILCVKIEKSETQFDQK